MKLLQKIFENAKLANKKIILPEGFDERVLKAADIILEKELANLIILGNKEEIEKNAADLKLNHINKAEIIDPSTYEKSEYYAEMLTEIRKKKGLTIEKARTLVKDPLYLSTLLIKDGKADGEVAGAANTTGDVLRPAFQVVKTLPGISTVSGAFLMMFDNCEYAKDDILVFADCAVNPDLDAKQLADVAISSALTAKSIAKIDPVVAMLSFSTKGSAKHESVDKIVEATKLVNEINPNIIIDGEMQVDAALVDTVAKKKAPDSKVAGKANVLIFPSLESGNIGYKLVQRLAGAKAVGPILQGMAAPINDLSRGCSVDDIVNLVAITANQANS